MNVAIQKRLNRVEKGFTKPKPTIESVFTWSYLCQIACQLVSTDRKLWLIVAPNMDHTKL